MGPFASVGFRYLRVNRTVACGDHNNQTLQEPLPGKQLPGYIPITITKMARP